MNQNEYYKQFDDLINSLEEDKIEEIANTEIPYHELQLWERELIVHAQVATKQIQWKEPPYRVVFEDDLDSPAKVLIPSPQWWTMALMGGILPPVEVYHNIELDEKGTVLNGYILHETPPINTMTEEQAIEYLLKKDVPVHVWSDTNTNRKKFKICLVSQIPSDREFRNAWKLNEV